MTQNSVTLRTEKVGEVIQTVKEVTEELTLQDVTMRKQSAEYMRAGAVMQLQQLQDKIADYDKELTECDTLLAMFVTTAY